MADLSALGTDFYCEEDISDDLAYESDPLRAYVQACFRRLSLSTLFYADPYGASVFQFVLETGATSDQIRGAIIAALMLDERTEHVEVNFTDQRIRIKVTARVQPSFTFTLEIDKVSAAITEIE